MKLFTFTGIGGNNSFDFPQAIAQSMDELSSPEIQSPKIDFDFAGAAFEPDAVFDPDAAKPVAKVERKTRTEPKSSFSQTPPEQIEIETKTVPLSSDLLIRSRFS